MVKNKRDSLEKFIRTQLLGPGACNNRFALKDHPEDASYDIINTTPGSLYSTAILFPKKADEETIDEIDPSKEVEDLSSHEDLTTEKNQSYVLNTPEPSTDDPDSHEDTDTDIDPSDKTNVYYRSEEDDIYSLNQHFPTTIGISCCLDPGNEVINANDVQITISGRYYTQVPVSKRTDIVVRIEEDRLQFDQFFEAFKERLSPYFECTPRGVSALINLSPHFVIVKQTLREINQELAKKIAFESNGKIDELYLSITNKEYRYLKSYKSVLWRKIAYTDRQAYISAEEKSRTLLKIAAIEQHETFLSYLEDVIAMYSPKSYGFWVGKKFTKPIDLSGINFNEASHDEPGKNRWFYSPEEHDQLRNIAKIETGKDTWAALSVWLQITKEDNKDRSSKRYLKIQLQNNSTEIQETKNSYFSVVSEKVNRHCFFGVEIKVESPYLNPYKQKTEAKDPTNEDVQLDYLYRSIEDYGVGHHCSVDWSVNGGERCIRSEFIPSYETPKVDTVPRDKTSPYVNESERCVPKRFISDSSMLEIKRLSTLSNVGNEEIICDLHRFVDAYKSWIDTLKKTTEHHPVAAHNIQACERDYDRMKQNIDLILQENDSNLETFRLMNSAMFLQFWHTKNKGVANERTSEEFYRNASDLLFGKEPVAWRPFQLAFILLNLDGIFQRSDDLLWFQRNEQVDLVWFPTGGGKTEAYLGIIALAIIHRRKTGEHSLYNGGTAAIMRYTLRLLATQQFQRAARLILALEQIRQWNKYNLGSEPISIGLYVGQDALPNKIDDLCKECLKWRPSDTGERGVSKIPLDTCFWCDHKLTFDDRGSGVNREIVFKCINTHCTFTNSIPIILCDEQIYKTPPTLLFGTVDKFASLAHKTANDKNKENQDSRRIFGRGNLSNRPPDLIIQDELHLLLGPLGSAVGFYESAIDQLCTYSFTDAANKEIKVRPKIISSTATTRNTKLQIRALYDRDVEIFPKSGVDHDDSFFAFFAREKVDGNVEYISNRKYIGVLPTGRTQMTTQMRLIATMFVHRALFEKEHADRLHQEDVAQTMDYYHTVINYFNSLKEVGKADAQFYTEFTKYTRRLFKRVLRYSHMLECFYGYDSSFNKVELTGRLTGTEVINELAQVTRRWDARHRLPHPSETDDTKWQRSTLPPDIILATNMISVGIDIDRFNTMLINSMPRNIAEYIQASSRVARDKEGLVITLHNPFRLRDLSHFEKFREFHEKLYYFVEPISVTPFSTKSVDRYISLYLATMIRHLYPEMADQRSAGKMDASKAKVITNELMQYFETRMKRTSHLEDELKNLLTPSLKEHIEETIEQALGQWCQLSENQSVEEYTLYYSFNPRWRKGHSQKIKPKGLFLDIDAYEENEPNSLWTVPYSLRTIDSEAIISVIENNKE